jgi:serine/threonine-protein kinase RsbW
MFGEMNVAQVHRFCGPEPLISEEEEEDMARARAGSPVSGDSRPSAFVGLRHTLPSRVEMISPFVDQLMRFISRFRGDENNFGIERALREALANAIVHGNREDPHKRVYVKCRCSGDGEVSISVEDEGHGFENGSIPDTTPPDYRRRTQGHGIYLMKTLMDEVDFEQGGSVVHMRKRMNASSDRAIDRARHRNC